jgi:hypothetical protein
MEEALVSDGPGCQPITVNSLTNSPVHDSGPTGTLWLVVVLTWLG